MVTCTFEMEQKTKDRLEKVAGDNYRSLSAQIRLVLEEFLDCQLEGKGRRKEDR